MSYALQSMTHGTNRERDGHVVLGSGNDEDVKDNMVVVSRGRLDNSSEEFIFSNSEEGIHQKTEITITAELKPESRVGERV